MLKSSTMKTLINRFLLSAVVLLVSLQITKANISLPEIFSDNMVLQQNSAVIFWGWASPGEKVVIKGDWMSEEISALGSVQGTWKITMKTPSAGGPFNIHLKGQNEIILKNVLIGEVWLCSGQSNMQMS